MSTNPAVDDESIGETRDETPGDGREPITRRVHENSWSANLEEPHHEDDPDRIVEEAIDAIDATASGYHVNLVTHASCGHPETFLWPALESDAEATADRTLEWEYVDQCGCGGHVTRVHVG